MLTSTELKITIVEAITRLAMRLSYDVALCTVLDAGEREPQYRADYEVQMTLRAMGLKARERRN